MFKAAALYYIIGGSIQGLAEMGCPANKLHPLFARLVKLAVRILAKEELEKDIDSLDEQIMIKLSALIDELEAEVNKQ